MHKGFKEIQQKSKMIKNNDMCLKKAVELIKKIQKQIHEEYRNVSPLISIPFDSKNSKIDPSEIQYIKRQTLLPKPQVTSQTKFGTLHTDYMLDINNIQGEWQKPQIKPFENISMHPFSSAIHYAVQSFEGMKAFKDKKNNVRLFRPDLNMNRFRRSCLRISLPDFNTEGLLSCIEQLIKIEKDWVPGEFGQSLYIRPTGISMSEALGVRAPSKSKIFVVNSPVGPYYPSGFTPIGLYCDHRNIRAAPQGYGSFKLGCNYGPTIALSNLAEKQGYEQILWLYKNQLLEVGTSNLFILWTNLEGQLELVTPKADDLILHGVTRDSVLALSREFNRFPVVEKNITIDELILSVQQKRIVEVFTSGTAVTIGPVHKFMYKDQEYQVPIDKEIGAGKFAKELSDKLHKIYYGEIDHPWSKIVA